MMKETDMSKFVIETAIRENYAAHNDDWDGVSEYWKNKGGNTYIVEADTAEEAKTVVDLVTSSSNAYEENFFDFFPCDDNFESEFVKSQKEFDPKGWETLYTDNLIRKNKKGDWYMKRGYVVGEFQKGTQYEHLVGKFVGNVDNLSTGECVLKIEGDTRTHI
tara:strand:- start:656 stop:1141 length:486 start_codon:yes stop_codon:yes gene_type:complete